MWSSSCSTVLGVVVVVVLEVVEMNMKMTIASTAIKKDLHSTASIVIVTVLLL